MMEAPPRLTRTTIVGWNPSYILFVCVCRKQKDQIVTEVLAVHLQSDPFTNFDCF